MALIFNVSICLYQTISAFKTDLFLFLEGKRRHNINGFQWIQG